MSGTNLSSEENLIWLLRERLQKEKSTESKMEQNAYAGLIIKAWNLWLTRGTVKHIRYRYHQESLPVIVTGRHPGVEVENYESEFNFRITRCKFRFL